MAIPVPKLCEARSQVRVPRWATSASAEKSSVAYGVAAGTERKAQRPLLAKYRQSIRSEVRSECEETDACGYLLPDQLRWGPLVVVVARAD